jgi:nucleotide sugar dehydrogenase
VKITPSEISITVVGLGYVGLPTALAFHKAGFSVSGVDISDSVVSKINSGAIPFFDESLEEKIPIESDRWKVTTDYGMVIPDSDIVLITVPTPVTKNNEPNLEYVYSACRSVLENLNVNRDIIITLESTVFPGVTRSVFAEVCEDLSIEMENPITLAYSPERVSPGDPLRTVDKVARIIGCDDQKTGEFLTEVYSLTTSEDCTYVGKIEVAEASKLIENVQRDIDIAFVNELSIVLPKIGLDVEEVLSAASTKWNFHRHSPGIGVGGHCIPVDPYFYLDLSERTGNKSLISSAARSINESMPSLSAEEITALFQRKNIQEPKILILGYSYKPETGDVRDTPVLEFSEKLSSSGATIFVWDPFVAEGDFPTWVEELNHPLEKSELDMVVLATAHQQFMGLDWGKLGMKCNTPRIYDGRRVLRPSHMEKIGWEYHGIGYPTN